MFLIITFIPAENECIEDSYDNHDNRKYSNQEKLRPHGNRHLITIIPGKDFKFRCTWIGMQFECFVEDLNSFQYILLGNPSPGRNHDVNLRSFLSWNYLALVIDDPIVVVVEKQ